MGLAGAVTKNLPVGRALGGAVMGAVGAAGTAVGTAAAKNLGRARRTLGLKHQAGGI